jgi:hypothetical protein
MRFRFFWFTNTFFSRALSRVIFALVRESCFVFGFERLIQLVVIRLLIQFCYQRALAIQFDLNTDECSSTLAKEPDALKLFKFEFDCLFRIGLVV